jgi:predicted DNA-binding transcriptional regulator
MAPLTTRTKRPQELQESRRTRQKCSADFGEVLEGLVLSELGKASNPVSIKDLQLRISPTLPVAVVTVASALDRLYREGRVFRRLVTEGGTHYVYSTRVLDVRNLAEISITNMEDRI